MKIDLSIERLVGCGSGPHFAGPIHNEGGLLVVGPKHNVV